MPMVKIYIWEGRDKKKKQELVEKVTSAVVDAISCPREAVQVIIEETKKENWGLGGQLASEKFPDK